MRTVKEPEIRKNEILDAADTLFARKGFDNTSTGDILEMVGIARGTLYYHFKSKEDILDALIERYNRQILSAAQEAASDKRFSVKERLILYNSCAECQPEGRAGAEGTDAPAAECADAPENTDGGIKRRHSDSDEADPGRHGGRILSDSLPKGVCGDDYGLQQRLFRRCRGSFRGAERRAGAGPYLQYRAAAGSRNRESCIGSHAGVRQQKGRAE